MVGVGVLELRDRVGVGCGVFSKVGVALIAFSVIATRVAAWSSNDGSEDEPGRLHAKRKNSVEIDTASASLRFFIGHPYFGLI